jgi:hypothetical protein
MKYSSLSFLSGDWHLIMIELNNFRVFLLIFQSKNLKIITFENARYFLKWVNTEWEPGACTIKLYTAVIVAVS